MNPTVYVITYYAFNHGPLRPGREQLLDERFLKGSGNYVYYLIDKEVPLVLKERPTILEYDLDPVLHKAGGKFFGEWSFLLAEEKYSFCKYPLFMTSSRFYEKNHWLYRDLNAEWNTLFSCFQKFGWGYLPSYDRPLRWINLEWENHIKNEVWKYKFFPFTEKLYELIENVFGVNIPGDYGFTADLFCNYIGFRSRQELLDYVSLYRPLLDFFFDDSYELKRDLAPYIRYTGAFRNEKSFTFILELLSHLFFFQKKKKYFALHYDGYYLINENSKRIENIERFALPLELRLERQLRWQWHRLNTEGCLTPLRVKWNQWKAKS
ncbi:MAG: hypothetical protein KGZ39_07535 [Simkania sp.]|nr:hypothetical protein [Simkania sp.]